MKLPHEKYVALYSCGDAQMTATNPRAVNLPNWPTQKFSFYDLTALIEEIHGQGFRRHVIWQAFGINELQTWTYSPYGLKISFDTVLSIEDWLHIKELAQAYTPYQEMVDTFVPAIQEYIAKYPDDEIIAYIGTAVGCPAFEALAATGDTDGIVSHMLACLSPYLAAGITSFIFDAACGVPPGHWLLDCIRRLERMGMQCAVEAAPHNLEHNKHLGFMSSVEQLKNVIGNTTKIKPTVANGAFVGFLDPSLVVKERMGLEDGAPPKRYATVLAWLCELIPRVFNAGQIDSMCLDSYWFKYDPSMKGMSLNEFDFSLSRTNDSDYGNFVSGT